MTLRELARAIEDRPARRHRRRRQDWRRAAWSSAPPHPDDNRRKLVHLTEAGRETAHRGQAILDEPPAPLAGLSADDLARLEEILHRLDRLDRDTETAR